MPLDFESVADNNTPQEGPALARLQSLVDEVDEIDTNIDTLEEMLKSARGRLNEIKTQEIPKRLNELQTTEWTNAKTGTKVKLSDFVAGSLPKEPEKREEAIKYLESLEGGPSLFKTSLTIEFSRHGHNEALALADDMRKLGHTPIIESGVHAATLQSYVKEGMKRGDNIDPVKLGVFVGRTTKITKKKVKPGSDK